MYNLEVKSKLTFQQRLDIDKLIFDVWSHEQLQSADVEMISSTSSRVRDPLDQAAIHVLVTDSNRLVGYGRLTILSSKVDSTQRIKEIPIEVSCGKYAYISRLVVHPSARGRGIAGLIDEARISVAKAHGADLILGCAVGQTRCDSLKRSGFISENQVQTFENPWYRTTRPVQLMKLDLTSDEIKIRSSAF